MAWLNRGINAFQIKKHKCACKGRKNALLLEVMDPKTIVHDLKCRAAAIGLKVPELCRRAEIAPSTVNRWLSGDTMPNLRLLARVEKILAEAERERAA